MSRDHVLRAEGLELDRIGSRCKRRIGQLQGHGHVTVVVHAGFGDDKDFAVLHV